MRLHRLLPLFAVLSFSISAQASLTIGDKAPELKVTDWVKGTPVALGKGKPVVVEFWATWCGPCKESIPHLSEMAKKYAGKVDFVGVSVWESKPEDYKTKVPSFVKAMGEKMAYSVATEGPNSHMANEWLKSAGERGIPSAFLVDGEGKIAWIGHPMEGLDGTIDSVLGGTYDMTKARAQREASTKAMAAEMAKQDEMQMKLAPAINLAEKKNFKGALVEIDKLWIKEPTLRGSLGSIEVLVRKMGNLGGISKALKKLETLPEMKDPMYMSSLIYSIVSDESGGGVDSATLKAAVKLGQRMMKLTPTSALNADIYAMALWRSGDKKGALSLQKKAIEWAKTDKSIPAEFLLEMKAHLKQYGG